MGPLASAGLLVVSIDGRIQVTEATMPRHRTPEEVRRLKERGVIDVGTSYLPVVGFDRKPRHRFWDGYVPRES